MVFSGIFHNHNINLFLECLAITSLTLMRVSLQRKQSSISDNSFCRSKPEDDKEIYSIKTQYTY